MNCNYKVKITDIQTKYKFKVFCTGYDDSEIKEKIDAMYQAWPKASAEGETPTLDNTANATMSIDLKGNTSQDTTTGKNLFNINGDVNVRYNGTTTTSNVVSGNDLTVSINTATGHPAGQKIYVGTGNSVTLSAVLKSSTYDTQPSANDGVANMILYNDNISTGTQGISFTYSEIGTRKSVTFTATTDYIFATFGSRPASTSATYTDIQVEIGSTATSWEKFTYGASPNPNYPQDVHVVTGDNTINITGKNLFSLKDWLSTLGATYTENSDGSLTFTPITALYNTTYPIKETDRCMMSFKIKNGNGSNFRFRYVYEDGTMTETSGSGTGTSEVSVATSSSVPTAHGKVIGIRGNWTIAGTFTIKECMLEQLIENVSPQPYEPYQSQSYAVNLGTLELCKIGDYQDYIYKDNKKWYKYGAIGKVVLNGSESGWVNDGGSAPYKYVISDIKNPPSNAYTEVFCNNYYPIPYNDNWNNYDYLITRPQYTSTTQGVKFKNKDIGSLNDFKTWLSTHNTIVYYVLATPTTTEITDATLISQLNALAGAESYSGQTNISQTNDDKPFILTVKALKDLSNL